MAHKLSIADLARRCAKEMTRFQRRQSHNPEYCYELFRLALVNKDQKAWAAIYDQYHRLVRRQLGNVPAGDSDTLTNQAFERLWRAIPPERFVNFPTLAKLLAYLKRCAQSVTIDAQRREERRRICETNLMTLQKSRSKTSEIDHLLDEIVGEQVFEHTRECLNTLRERLVFQASFEWDLKPRMIARRWPEFFADAREVSRVKERILRRLRRDQELKALLEIGNQNGGES